MLELVVRYVSALARMGSQLSTAQVTEALDQARAERQALLSDPESDPESDADGSARRSVRSAQWTRSLRWWPAPSTLSPQHHCSTHVRAAQQGLWLPAELTGLQVDSKAQAEQVRSVTVERVGPLLGRVPPAVMRELDEALRLHLQL